MGICESKTQENPAGPLIAPPVEPKEIQPIISHNIQPVFIKLSITIIRQIIQPVYVRNQMEAESLKNKEKEIFDNPNMIKAINSISDAEKKEIDEYVLQAIDDSVKNIKVENIDDILAKRPKPSPVAAATPPPVDAANKGPIIKYLSRNVIDPNVQPEVKFLLQMQIEPILYNP